MAKTRITINGQQYDSPDKMPPEVRRTYEEALRTLPDLAAGLEDASARAIAEGEGPPGAGIVVNRVVTMSDRIYATLDDLPPEVRKLYEDAILGVTAPVSRLDASVHVTVKRADEPRASRRTGLQPASELESTIRGIPEVLGITIVIVLVLWYILSR